MNIDSFFRHHALTANPFDAEEARHDPVFEKLMDTTPGHPDFSKILGNLNHPSTAVVFGEKGSGKTAIRLMIGKRVAEHNDKHPDQRTLVVPFDDLNPVLDRIANRRRSDLGFSRAAKTDPQKILSTIRLEDHQDAILSLAVTALVDSLIESEDASPDTGVKLLDDPQRLLKKMPRPRRMDLAVLSALYDEPRSGAVAARWAALRSRLKLSWLPAWPYKRYLAIVLTLVAVGFFIGARFTEEKQNMFNIIGGIAAGLGGLTWGLWLFKHFKLWKLSRKIHREVASVDRPAGDLRLMLLDLPGKEMQTQPFPLPDEHDARYQLTRKLLAVLEHVGYRDLMVLVDRVDEPTLVHGRAERMKPIIWPMFDNKFLQQEHIGFKLLLPIELRHELHRESADFFQEARMDKQSMIDRLMWSGATLYDLASNRLRAVKSTTGSSANPDTGTSAEGASAGSGDSSGASSTDSTAGATATAGEASLVTSGGSGVGGTLTDLFATDVSREMLVDALDQMHQPRDAFKFLYQVIQEHCNTVPDDDAVYRIPRLTLETIRRQQSQRVQDLGRGLAPA